MRPTISKAVVGVLLVLFSLLAWAKPTATNSFEHFEVVATVGVCDIEDIFVSGDVHTLAVTNEDPSGRIHITIHHNENLSAVGVSSGKSYQLIKGDIVTLNTTADALPITLTVVQSGALVGTGQITDIIFNAVFKVTIDANGNVRTDFDRFFFECK